MAESEIAEAGVFGNIWVRSHRYAKKGDRHRGHYHHFDHVTLVATGGVLCSVEDEAPKEVWAPGFIPIRKDKKHRFTALADDTRYFCIFAVRDNNGEVVDVCAQCNGCDMVPADSQGTER